MKSNNYRVKGRKMNSRFGLSHKAERAFAKALACGPASHHGRFSNFQAKKWEARCAKRGHQIVDDSYGGPESGNIDIYCKRCGMVLANEQLY